MSQTAARRSFGFVSQKHPSASALKWVRIAEYLSTAACLGFGFVSQNSWCRGLQCTAVFGPALQPRTGLRKGGVPAGEAPLRPLPGAAAMPSPE